MDNSAPLVKNRLDRLYGLDFLRGLCALLVMIYHYLAWSTGYIYYPFGTYGVYVFFVLSGYSLYYVYCHQVMDEVALKSFWAARFFRIFPLFFFICLLYSVVLGDHSRATLTQLLLNISFLFGFTNPGQNSLAIGGWSIGIEFVFYFLFPLFWLCRRQQQLAYAFVASLVLSYLYVRNVFNGGRSLADAWNDYIQAVSFLPFFVGGCWLASLGLSSYPQRFYHLIASTLGLFVLFVCPFLISQDAASFLRSLWFVAWVLLSLLVVWGWANIKLSVFFQKVATRLGDLSFSVYLLHPYIWNHFDAFHLPHIDNVFYKLVLSMLLTILSAMILYKFLEVPCRAVGRKLAVQIRQ